MLRPRASAGFTLIEMVIAITILAIIALISWRSLDGIIRGQHRLTESLEETRAIDRLFEQLQTDFGEAVRDDDLGQPTVVFGDGDLRIVRMLRDARQPIRWQVVRYRVDGGSRSFSAAQRTRPRTRSAECHIAGATDAGGAHVGAASTWVDDTGVAGIVGGRIALRICRGGPRHAVADNPQRRDRPGSDGDGQRRALYQGRSSGSVACGSRFNHQCLAWPARAPTALRCGNARRCPRAESTHPASV